jgi:hypothetical protein
MLVQAILTRTRHLWQEEVHSRWQRHLRRLRTEGERLAHLAPGVNGPRREKTIDSEWRRGVWNALEYRDAVRYRAADFALMGFSNRGGYRDNGAHVCAPRKFGSAPP